MSRIGALTRRLEEARTTLGDRDARRVKRARALATLGAFLDRAERRRRMESLTASDPPERLPNDWQLVVGSYRMFADFLLPASARFYEHTGKDFTWQQVLRFLDEPCAVMDPTGLAAPIESILSHLIQVTHHEAGYDVELLRMFPGGLETLVDEVRQLVEGRHPRQRAIEAIVEEPDYHRRLLEALERYLADPETHWRVTTVPVAPGTEALFEHADRYATPARFVRYCAGMPRTPLASLAATRSGRRRPRATAA